MTKNCLPGNCFHCVIWIIIVIAISDHWKTHWTFKYQILKKLYYVLYGWEEEIDLFHLLWYHIYISLSFGHMRSLHENTRWSWINDYNKKYLYKSKTNTHTHTLTHSLTYIHAHKCTYPQMSICVYGWKMPIYNLSMRDIFSCFPSWFQPWYVVEGLLELLILLLLPPEC